MVTGTIEELRLDSNLQLANHPKVLRLQLAAQRANHELIQLLMLYKYEIEKLTPNITENNLEDFLEEIAMDHRALAQAHGITISVQCDPSLFAYFDENLLRNVISSSLGNAQRHTRDSIRLSAEQKEQFMVLRVEDNGDGFPDDMLAFQAAIDSLDSINQGRTQLGLYFANLIARSHTNRTRKGFIRLENSVNLEGGCFSIWLP